MFQREKQKPNDDDDDERQCLLLVSAIPPVRPSFYRRVQKTHATKRSVFSLQVKRPFPVSCPYALVSYSAAYVVRFSLVSISLLGSDKSVNQPFIRHTLVRPRSSSPSKPSISHLNTSFPRRIPNAFPFPTGLFCTRFIPVVNEYHPTVVVSFVAVCRSFLSF